MAAATPEAAGLVCSAESGHVSQAYFNGVHIPGLLSLRTLIAKLVSATFVLAAGLIAEGEAPFVHIGTIVGGGITAAGSRHAPVPPSKCCMGKGTPFLVTAHREGSDTESLYIMWDDGHACHILAKCNLQLQDQQLMQKHCAVRLML